MPVHNEERYLPVSLEPLRKAQINELVVILDRCTDNSESIVRKNFPRAKIIRKQRRRWRNSYAENLQLGYEHAIGDVLCIHDADIKSAPELFDILIAELKGSVASVSPSIQTYVKASFLNFLYYHWEKTRRIAPFGEEPRGGFRFIRRDCLEKVGGFKDVIAPDTQLDIDLRNIGYQSKLYKDYVCLHMRNFSFRKAINSQVLSGKMRRDIHMSFWRVLGHAIIRLRPFVLYGYLKN
ncbi:MAG: glycosyltransferase [Candidatus Bathyarchaeota archaeon]|nr:glycosyltransferase [Candidatus Bathyarchaeota archaeon]